MRINKPKHTKHIGELTESIVVSILLSYGITVLKPYGDNVGYDLVIYYCETFLKIQVKTGKLNNGVIRFNTSRNRLNTKEVYRKMYSEKEVDYFFIYCYETEGLYVVVNDDKIPSCSMSLRVSLPNNDSGTCNYVEDYMFDKHFIVQNREEQIASFRYRL